MNPIPMENNPLIWWKENHEDFPLLARYYKAHSSFQATSTASERVFNVDKRVFDEKRRSLDPERGTGLVFLQEYLNKRFNKDSFKLCNQCPQPPNNGVKYKISCAKHNGVQTQGSHQNFILLYGGRVVLANYS